MTKVHQLHPNRNDRGSVMPSADLHQADKTFGDRIRSLEERQARRQADRETMNSRAGMRKFAAGLAIGAVVVVGAIEGLKLYVSGENQQNRANHAALQDDFVKPTEAELKGLGFVEPPNNSEK